MAKGRKKSTLKRKSTNLTGDVYTLISYSYIGKLIFALLIAGIVILISIIASQNDFDLFFRITGIAILVITVISWIVYLLKRK